MPKSKYLSLFCIPLLIFSCIPRNQNAELPVKLTIDIFAPLEKAIAENNWGINNKEKADLFEQIYFKYSGVKEFDQVLEQYLDNQDKCYWIGIYADDDYYTTFADPVLAVKILEKGLEFTRSDQEKVRFLWIIGKKLYYKGDKSAATAYLVKAYRLAEEYPGNTPSWDSEQEYDEIMAFIKGSNEKDQ